MHPQPATSQNRAKKTGFNSTHAVTKNVIEISVKPLILRTKRQQASFNLLGSTLLRAREELGQKKGRRSDKLTSQSRAIVREHNGLKLN